jgi:hypothetical protein
MAAMWALLAVAALQARPALPDGYPSRHYDMRTSATPDQAKELLDFMELVHGTYLSLLKPENPGEVEKRRFTLLLYKDSREYVQSGAPPGSGAYYNGQELVGWYDDTFMRPFFAHEGMHQFTDATSKNFRDFPMWFTEGIADCVGNCEVKNDKLYMCVKSGMISRMRLQTVQGALRAGQYFPLRRLLTLPRDQFMQNAELCYAESWSFCHFLITYPKEEDRSVQIPNGKYRKNLAGYYEAVRSGKRRPGEAFEQAFKGIPLDDLQDQWAKYVLSLDGGKYMGVRGKELEDVEGLAIDAGFSGIKLEEVLAEGVAGKAGLKAGDILIKFNGKRFPRHDAMNRLRVWMQDIPAGRPVKVAVLRAGQPVELSCVWDK